MAKKTTSAAKKSVETLMHDEASRKNIPTAELQSVVEHQQQKPIRVAYERRNRDLDPQLVWRGKDEQDWSDLVVHAPPLYIQEKVHPKVLIDDLLRRSKAEQRAADPQSLLIPDLFADFNGLPDTDAKTEFYQHDAHWSNRMILGDSLQVMASLAEREGLRGKVQCIYFDPPYGIKFNSNFQWSTTSRDVKDGKTDHITREPEQVKAFRDTWRDGIHSYLTYLRDRLTVARDLLTESGSIFVQIGDENVHRVKCLLDAVFGDENFCSLITFQKTAAVSSPEARTNVIGSLGDYVLWYARSIERIKYRQPYARKGVGEGAGSSYKTVRDPDGTARPITNAELVDPSLLPQGARVFQATSLQSPGFSETLSRPVVFQGQHFTPNSNSHWKTTIAGIGRLALAHRVQRSGKTIRYVRYVDDFGVSSLGNMWTDLMGSQQMIYVVQTNTRVVERCVQMATDPGDLVLDPTCGSGTTAYVAEQWGRRWITIDTSRVALALARARIMGARYPYYLLADSRDGQLKEAQVSGNPPSSQPAHANIRHGFVYERVPHITLKSIANNAEIDVIWEKRQAELEPLREKLNAALKQEWQEWEIPREADAKWPAAAKKLHAEWWQARIARQREIDASIAAKAEYEYLYDKPYEDNKKVRVAGPFTVESIAPHRVLTVGLDDALVDPQQAVNSETGEESGFVQMVLENLKTAGVQQAHKEDRITLTSIAPWPGRYVTAEGVVARDSVAAAPLGTPATSAIASRPTKDSATESRSTERRAAIFIGPEFGTVARQDLVQAALEAGDANFDVLIACAFNYEAHASEFNKLGRIPVLKARMNADLHMADQLKNTGKGNLFVIFGEPDIEIIECATGEGGPRERGQAPFAPRTAQKEPVPEVRVKINGVDVFHPNTGEVRSDGAEGIACWFIDTDYNDESFFVRHAYFLGANDPYKSLKTTLKAEINEEAWATLHSDISRPFAKPKSGRIAVKVINHLGDEVMKIFRVP